MTALQPLLEARDIDFDPRDRRIRCFPHVINICCQHVISAMPNAKNDDSTDDIALPYPANPDTQSYEEALKRDPISLAHKLVTALRSSGMRRDKFEASIRYGNEHGIFGDGVHVKPLQLLRSVQTRWDSVFMMLNRLRSLRPVSLQKDYFID